MGFTKDQLDACSGIALLYMGSDEPDEYVERLHAAMEAEDVDEAEHVSAVMVAMLVTRVSDKSARFAAERWREAFKTGNVSG